MTTGPSAKGARRSSASTKRRKISPTLCPYPTDELHTLFHETGKATIQGVHFDLRPEELAKKGFVPWSLKYGWNPFLDSGLGFPWDETDSNVRAGDLVKVESISPSILGNKLDHESDQAIMYVEYVVYRSGKKLNLDLAETEYVKSATFLLLLDFETAIKRLQQIIKPGQLFDWATHVESVNPDITKGALSNEELAATLGLHYLDARYEALVAARNASAAWNGIVAANKKSSGTAQSLVTVRRIFKLSERALDSATAFGYWLAKSEFAPHASRAIASLDKSEKTSRALRVRPNNIWRDDGLAFAVKARAATPEISQRALAKVLRTRLLARPRIDPAKPLYAPEYETILEQISKWERQKILQPSTQNRHAARLGGKNNWPPPLDKLG